MLVSYVYSIKNHFSLSTLNGGPGGNWIQMFNAKLYNLVAVHTTRYISSRTWYTVTGSRWSPVRTLPVAPLWCDLGFKSLSANLATSSFKSLNLKVYHSMY